MDDEIRRTDGLRESDINCKTERHRERWRQKEMVEEIKSNASEAQRDKQLQYLIWKS